MKERVWHTLPRGPQNLPRQLEHFPTRPPLFGLASYGLFGCHRRSSDHLQSSTRLPCRRDMGDTETSKVSRSGGRSTLLQSWPTSVLSTEIQALSTSAVSRTQVFLRHTVSARSGGIHLLEGSTQLQTLGVPNDVKRFKTRQKAECFVQLVTLGQPPLPCPTATLFTDGSTSKALGTAGWGVHICHRPPC